MKHLYDEPLFTYGHSFIPLGLTPEEYYKEHEDYEPVHALHYNPLDEVYGKYCRIKDALEGGSWVNADFFRIFHRMPESFFSFHGKRPHTRKDTGKDGEMEYSMKELGAVKAKDAEEGVSTLLAYSPEVINDFYFTVNSYYSCKKWKHKNGLNGMDRSERNLSYLNACYVDIDVGRFRDENHMKKFTWKQALFAVLLLEYDGIIPEASAYVRSGRGLYVFWLLEKSTKSLGNIDRYKKINRALQKRIAPALYVDSKASDAARFLRAEGGIHSKTKLNVTYCFNRDGEGAVKCHSLDDLQVFTEEPQPPGRKVQRAENTGRAKKYISKAVKTKVPARMQGPVQSNLRRFIDLCGIARNHRGFKHGKRYHSLQYASRFMRLAGFEEQEIIQAATKIAGVCNPPYPTPGEANDIPVANIVRHELAGKGGLPLNLRNEYLANFFEVDTECAERLHLRSIRPSKASETATAAKASDRHKAIIEILSKGRCSFASIVKALAGQHGMEVTRMTVMRDLRLLEKNGDIPHTEPLKAGRPKKPPYRQIPA